jgi:hypothetical protein
MGQTIRAQLLLRPNVREVSFDLFEKMAQYAMECHDRQIADSLFDRIGPRFRASRGDSKAGSDGRSESSELVK